MNDRKLSTFFFQSLTQYQKGNPGILNPILKRVQDDDTLDLQIREGYINIYYRGGNILWIKELKGNGFEFKFDQGYAKEYLYTGSLFDFIIITNFKSMIHV